MGPIAHARISKHAVWRFCQRTGCKSFEQARETLRRIAGRATPAKAIRHPNGRVELFPKTVFCADGCVLCVKEDTIATCYMADADTVLGPKP